MLYANILECSDCNVFVVVLACWQLYVHGPQAIKRARILGKASCVMSIAGIIVGVLIVAVVLLVVVCPQFMKFSRE